MTNEQILELYDGLYEICQNTELKFKVTTSFLLAKNKNLLDPLYNSICEARLKLLKKYGEERDQEWFVPNKNLDAFKTEFEALLKMDTFINLEEIPIKELESEKLNVELVRKLIPIIKQ